jgi:nucleoside-diphosphate kinase
MQRTLGIIKPDAFAAGHAGPILARITAEGFRLVGLKKLTLSAEQAGAFYHVHRGKGFFDDLTGFMSSGPCVVMALEAPEAIAKWRRLMGATNPADAGPGSLRQEFGTSLGRNAVHGSDAADTAAFEISFFFSGLELL